MSRIPTSGTGKSSGHADTAQLFEKPHPISTHETSTLSTPSWRMPPSVIGSMIEPSLSLARRAIRGMSQGARFAPARAGVNYLLIAGPVVFVAPAVHQAMQRERWGLVLGLLGFAALLIGVAQMILRAFVSALWSHPFG